MGRLIGWLDHPRSNSPKLQPTQKPARAVRENPPKTKTLTAR
jgi:hypothetical protein